ncbi:uncharacterized protein [Populus alba]|uniref:uncharacterized protein n=1 Tax=Populus alba TaxID=43335 RepID=UPI003CC75F8D
MTAGGKWQTSTPTISNIPRADKEKGTDNMSVIEEDQQSWPTSELGHNMTLRNGKQIGTIKCYEGHRKPPPDLPTACDEIGAMKEIGQKLGIETRTTEESIEVMIKEAIDAEQDHWESWNVCGLGSSSKRKAINNIKAQGRSGGLLAMWDEDLFRVDSIKYAGSWISFFGSFVDDAFDYVITGYYGASSRAERAASWLELTKLRHAFSDYPWFLISDFNETLTKTDRSSGLLDKRGALELQTFIDACELVEYPMVNHRFTWFRGGFMNCWLMAPSFQNTLKAFWQEIVHDIPGDFQAESGKIFYSERQRLYELKGMQWKLCRYVESIWRQKARQSWLKLGDRNTRFFHISAKVRGCKNYIRQLTYNEKILSSPNEIKEGAKAYFSNIYSESLTTRPTMGSADFMKLSENQAAWLEREVTIEEVHLAIFSSEGSKAPGPDGFNFNFYKKFWELMQHDLFTMVLEFFRRGYLPKAFIAGRNILDSVLIANEMLDSMKSRSCQGFLLKLDFRKAFDTVSWSYLNDVMGYMNFGARWRKWIMASISFARLSVLINGSPTSKFTASCGLRQGDPLSPFLFCLAAEGISVLISRSLKIGALYGVESVGTTYIHHLQFADDTLLFLPNDLQCLLNTKRMLCWFSLCSRLNVNFHKSSLVGVGVDGIYAEGISGVLRSRCDTFPIKYLGLPLGANPKRISTWKPVLYQIRGRLNSWKGRLLSLAGRTILIKSVISAIPLYYMSIFCIPKTVAHKITAMQAWFLWGRSVGNRKIHRLALDTVAKNKERGGLGVGNISAKNKALLFKWIWKLESNEKASWADFIKAKYRPQFINGMTTFKKKLSGIWRGIISTITRLDLDSSLIRAACKLKMGNGNYVKFWLDTWLTGFCLANSYLALFHLSSSKSGFVSQMGYWLEDTWYWNLKWRRPLKASETLMVQRLMSDLNLAAIHRLKEDRLIWEWGKDEDYTVNSCMLALERIRYAGSTTYVTNVWKSICPPKTKMTLWLALNEGLCTRAFLVKQHILSPQEDSIVWTIWNAKNNLIFEDQKPIWEDILWHLFYFAVGWIMNLNSSFWYTGADLYRNHECISAWSA